MNTTSITINSHELSPSHRDTKLDSVQRFIRDCCITGDLSTIRISKLYDSYYRW